VKGIGKKKRREKTASGRKRPISKKEISYLRKSAEGSAIVVFVGRKLLD